MTNRLSVFPWFGWGCAYLLAWWGLAQLAPLFQMSPLASVWFLPAGLSLAVMVRFGPGFWPWLAAAWVIAFIEFKPPGVSYWAFANPRAYTSTLYLLAYIGMAILIRRFSPGGSQAWGLRAVLGFVGSAALGTALITLIVAGIYAALGRTPFWSFALFRWTGDVIGILTLTPLLLLTPKRPPLRRRLATDAGVMLVALGALILAARLAPEEATIPWLLGAIPVLYAALRLGTAGAALTVPFFSVAIVLLWLGDLPPARLWEVQVFLIFVAMTGLLLGAAVTDQRRAALALLTAQQRRARRDQRQIDLLQSETGQFAAAVAHDLRHPLEAVRLLAQPLLKAADPTPGRLILAAVANARHLLDHLLDGTRLDRAITQGRIEALPVMTLFQRVGEVLGPIAAQQGVRLVLLPSRAVILAEPTLAYRLMVNLGTNAIRAAALNNGRKRVVIGTRRRQRGVAVIVADSGSGLSPSARHRLLGLRDAPTPLPDTAPDGLGLGLRLIRGIADALGLGLTVQRGTRGGTTVETLWPRPTDAPLPLETIGLVLPPGLARDLLEQAFAAAGVATLTATSGRALRAEMRALGVRQLDALVLDAPEQARHLVTRHIQIFRPDWAGLMAEITAALAAPDALLSDGSPSPAP